MRVFAGFVWLPLALLCAVFIAWLCLSLGFSGEVASVAGSVVGAVFAFAGERLMPLTPDWRGLPLDLRADFTHLIVSSALLPLMQLVLDRTLRLLWSGGTLWPDSLPLWMQVCMALLLMELIQYSAHRSMHRFAWLWRFHEVHHSPQRLQMWCAFRNHPVDTLLTVALPVAPLSWLGASPEVVALSVAIVGANATLQHSNISFRDNAFSWIISTAGLHRTHHRREIEVSQSNFGGFLILWDILLQTRRPPAEGAPVLGLERPFPTRYWQQIKAPFHR